VLATDIRIGQEKNRNNGSLLARPHLLHATAYGPILLGATFRPVASHSIGVKQSSSVVQPPPIPSLPAEALSFQQAA